MSKHEANAWIESKWLNQSVKQISGITELIGRSGIVQELMWDEKGALHCKMHNGWWCPASMLKIIEVVEGCC